MALQIIHSQSTVVNSATSLLADVLINGPTDLRVSVVLAVVICAVWLVLMWRNLRSYTVADRQAIRSALAGWWKRHIIDDDPYQYGPTLDDPRDPSVINQHSSPAPIVVDRVHARVVAFDAMKARLEERS